MKYFSEDEVKHAIKKAFDEECVPVFSPENKIVGVMRFDETQREATSQRVTQKIFNNL